MIDPVQVMALPDLEIVEIVRGGDLHHPVPNSMSTYRRHDRDLVGSPGEGTYLPTRSAVPLIGRVHGHRRISEHGLRPGRGDNQTPVRTDHGIAEVPEMAP